MAEEKDEKANKPTIQQSTTSSVNPTSIIKTTSNSASNLLSAEYNPTQNPKKDELVQSASIRILEVESLLDKLNNHIDKHHRQSSQKLQDFEQIHSELSKIQSTLISDEKTIAHKRRNKPSLIDPYIIIAPNHDDLKDNEEEKDDEKDNISVHNSTLTTLEPFQKLVSKIQKEIDPNHKEEIDNSNNSSNRRRRKRRSSIKVKKSELESINLYVSEHRNKMKEKTYQYEEKRKQLLSAKERLNKAKARFKKRLNKSKQKSERRNRAYSENKAKQKRYKNNKYHNHRNGHNNAFSDITSPKTNYNSKKFRIINESTDMDTTTDKNNKSDQLKTSKKSISKLSAANLDKLNSSSHNGSVSDTYSHGNESKKGHGNTHGMQASAPIYISKNHSPRSRSPKMGMISGGYYGMGHGRGGTNSSVASAFSTISDQSFVDDFHSITAELENIDDIVRNQVKSPSMTSIFSDLVSSPKTQSQSQSKDSPNMHNNEDNHVKNNISSMSGDSESNNTKNIQSYCSSIEIETDSLQSDLFHLQDIENQIGDL